MFPLVFGLWCTQETSLFIYFLLWGLNLTVSNMHYMFDSCICINLCLDYNHTMFSDFI